MNTTTISAVVTGGAGFIGSHVAERLLDAGYHVTILDDLSTGSIDNLPGSAAFHRVSINDVEASRLIGTIRPEILVHCAAQVSVPKSMQDPELDLLINVAGTARLIAAAKQAGAVRFIFFSSGGAIYGECQRPATEDVPPAPLNYYGVHKLAAEYHVLLSGLPAAILRPSNVYGPRQRADLEGGVVSIFADHAIEGRPLTIFGDGSNMRDFVHVHDVASAVIALLEARSTGICHVASGEAVRIDQLARMIVDNASSDIEIIHQPARAGDVHTSQMSNDKLRRATGWAPSIPLHAGVRTTSLAGKSVSHGD